MKTRFYLLFLLVVAGLLTQGFAQPKVFMKHYGPESGISQNSVTSILQDHKGMMWFSTYDGINRFDGQTFKTFKKAKGNQIYLSSNNVKQMKEDKYGYIWMLTGELRISRFDPRMETACQVPAVGAEKDLNIVSFELFDNGEIWLVTEEQGVMQVLTDPKTHQLSIRSYLPKQKVNKVCLDRRKNTWLLTNNGISCLRVGEDMPISYMVETDFSFYSLLERENEILFGSNKGEIVRYQKSDRSFVFTKLPLQDRVIAIDSLSSNELLFTSEKAGFVIYDVVSQNMALYNRKNCSNYPENRILSTYFHQKKKEVWFEVEQFGAVCYFSLPERRLFYQLIETENGVATRTQPIIEDVNGNEWVSPYGGGFSYFDRKDNRFVPFYNRPNAPGQKYSNKLHSIFFDRQGNLWFCSHSKGLERVTFLESKFYFNRALSGSNSRTLDNDVRSILEDKEHRLWVGFRNRYIRVFNDGLEPLGYLTKEGRIVQNGPHLEVSAYAIMQDKQNDIWIATKGDGVFRLKKQGDVYSITQFRHDPADIYSLSNNDTYSLHQDNEGRIWVATFGGGLNYIDPSDPQSKFVNYRNKLKNYPINDCPKVRHIASDKKGNLWLGTTNGAVYFNENFADAENIVFHHVPADPMEDGCLSSNDIHWIYAASNKELYLATYGGGLNKLVSINNAGVPTFKNYTIKNGLTSDALFTIQEDRAGHLWLSTEERLSKFMPEKEIFETYNDNNFGFRLRFKEGACATTFDNRIVFGSNQGLFSFYPDSIRKSSYIPSIVFSDLLLFNKVVPVGGKSPLKVCLDDMDKLVLEHDENNFTLQYAALDYRNPENIQYAYYLEGFDKEWQIVNKQHSASYNNLPKGKYTFHVRSTNGDGIWVDNARQLKIVVLPAFWESELAYVLYIIAVLLIILLLSHIRFVVYRLKNKVRVEQQIADIKLRFFTDISHEFRTPLTLISGPLEYVLENVPLPEDGKKHLSVVKQNTDRMLRLVNQILDFRKIQNHKMKMVVQDIDLVPFVRKVMDNFTEMAEEQKIDLRLEAPEQKLHLWADSDKLEKILFNLLSNAFKFTPSQKKISVVVKEEEGHITIEIHDQGIGISKEKIGSIFERFESLGNEDVASQSNSSGIGLSLVKELVAMHQGKIEVQSVLGEGSCFILTLPKGRVHYSEQTEFILGGQEEASEGTEKKVEPVALQEPLEASPVEEERRKLLLVEDNDELRFFLKDIFRKDYDVFEAANGKDGFEKAVEIQPDLIISDVMMPEKNGIEMTRDIRESMETSHIPIILLTAKSTIESKLEGLEYGADDYITKPFSTSYLKARVANLLLIRQKLSRLYYSGPSEIAAAAEQEEASVEEEKPQMTLKDRNFMEKLVGLIEANLDNGALVVDDLVKEFPMSRSTFGNKVKALTGMATVKFILEVRLRRAGELIRTGEYTCAQVYMVGFNDPHYFSKSFKQKFGITPTDYQQMKDS